MSKLADLISRGIPISAGHFGTDGMAAFVEELKTAPKIECSNVADYIYMGTSQEYWDLRVDFPNIAPPFQRFWMEWKAPKQSNSEGTIISNVNQDLSSRIGFFFNACLTSEMRLPSSKLPPSFRGREEYEKFFREHPEAKWYLTSSCFMLTKDECMVICLPLIHVNLIDASGKWVAHLPTMFGKYATEEEATDLGGNVIALSWPAWLAISFLHCKNVTMETEKVSDALRKATLKRHGVPMHTFKTLNIEPMRKVLRSTTPAGEQHDVKKALHICRGHFKDFREGRGLFGRTKGLFWWDAQVRGTIDAGISDHEYNVKAPKL